ncbi:hypothetical protein ACFX2I_000568 [Malus domestica]
MGRGKPRGFPTVTSADCDTGPASEKDDVSPGVTSTRARGLVIPHRPVARAWPIPRAPTRWSTSLELYDPVH